MAKAQVSIEFLLIVGFAMLMTIPLTLIFFKQSEALSNDISATQADRVASELRDAADEVYYMGAPSKKTLTVYLPREVDAITLIDNNIIFNVTGSGTRSEIVKWSAANFSSLSGLNATPGLKRITVEARAYDVLVTES